MFALAARLGLRKAGGRGESKGAAGEPPGPGPGPGPGGTGLGSPTVPQETVKKSLGLLMMAEGLGYRRKGSHCEPLCSAHKARISPRVTHSFFPGAVCLQISLWGWGWFAEPEKPSELCGCLPLRNFKKSAFYPFLKKDLGNLENIR